MKTPSSFLFDLVHSLTKTEKRYLKLRAGASDKDYLQLLDALLAQKQFDEQELLEQHKGANFVKHLAVNKRYLYELILDSLSRFGEKTIEQKVFTKITAVNVLIDKGLFIAASNELKKGKKLATKYELYELQIILNGLAKQLRAKQSPTKSTAGNVILDLFMSENDHLAQVKNTNEYWYLAQKMAEFQTRFQKIQTSEQQKDLASLTQSPLFNNQALATNFKSKIYFYQANAVYQFMLGNVKRAYEINSQFLDLLESSSHFLEQYAQRYLATLNNMLIDSLVIGDYDVLNTGINRLVKAAKRPEFKAIKNIESRVFRQRFLLLLNWSLSQKKYAEATEWIPEIEAGLKKFGHEIERHHRITFNYLISYILFEVNDFEKALEWNNKIINDPKEDVVKEIFHFSRTLNLLIHYELKNFMLLESLLLSTPKYLKSRRNIYATEKAIFRFLKRRISSIDKTEQQKHLSNFKLEIQELSTLPAEKRAFNYLDVLSWVERIELA